MLLSIVIPIYNAQNYLEECLRSVSACKEQNVEVLLIEDGSTDKSKDICTRFVKEDNRFRLITKENEGVSVARNRGIEEAQGEYLMFLDADDYMETSAWDIILKDIAQYEKDFIAYSYFTLYEDGKTVEEQYQLEQELSFEREDAWNILLTTARFNTCWGKLFRRSTIIQNHILFPPGVKTGEDALFVLAYFKHCKSFLVHNKSILYYRQNELSAMNQTDVVSKLKDFERIYSYRRNYAEDLASKNIVTKMNNQFFCVITNLLLQEAIISSVQTCKEVFAKIASMDMVKEIVIQVRKNGELHRFKKLEFYLFRKKYYTCLVSYFKLKAKIGQYI